MMDYEGGDLLLAGAACGRLLGHCAGLCLQAVGGDVITAWRLSFSDGMRVRGVLYMRCAIQIDVFTFGVSIIDMMKKLTLTWHIGLVLFL